MANTPTTNLGLLKPAVGDNNWADELNGNADAVDALFHPTTGHTHSGVGTNGPRLPAASIADFAESVDDRVAALVVAGTGITKTYDDVANTLTLAAAGGGHTIQDEGVALPQRGNLNFTGAGVTVTDDSVGNRSVVTIPGGGGSGSSPILARTTLAAPAAEIVLTLPSPLPSGVTDLEIVFAGRADVAAASVSLRMRFNGDATAIYDRHNFDMAGTGSGGGQTLNDTSGYVTQVRAANAPVGDMSIARIVVPGFAQTAFTKSYMAQSAQGKLLGGTDEVYSNIASGKWTSTAAITSITLFPESGNFLAGTVATVYASTGGGATADADATYRSEVAARSPVHFLPLDEKSGTSAANSGSSAAAGTYESRVVHYQPGPMPGRSHAAALPLDPASGITVPSAGTDFAADFTVALFVRRREAETFHGIFGKETVAFCYLRANRSVVVGIAGVEVIDTATAPAFLFVTDVWHHVAVVRAGAVALLYIDGIEIRNAACGTGGSGNTNPLIFGKTAAAANPLNGDVAYPAFFAAALTAAQIATLARAR